MSYLTDTPEAYYSQVCHTCDNDLSLIMYHRAGTERTCRRCFAAWLGVDLATAACVQAIHSLKLWHKLGRPYRSES